MSYIEKLICPYCSLQEQTISNFHQRHQLKKLWSFIPIVLCINLIDRPDRKKHAILEFHRVGLCDKVEFLMTQRPLPNEFILESDIKQIGTIGCWRSHMEAADIINQSRKLFGLIFEDDVLFVEDLKEIERGLMSLQNFIESEEMKWDLIYLGYWSFWIKPTKFISLQKKLNKSIIQKCHARCFHAYCIHRNFARKIRNETWEKQQSDKPEIFKNVPNFGIDTWSAYESKNSYCLLPLIATQAPIVSSNDRAINKKFIDLALSNPKFMRLNQYGSMLTSIFAHVFLWFLSPNYRKSVMA